MVDHHKVTSLPEELKTNCVIRNCEVTHLKMSNLTITNVNDPLSGPDARQKFVCQSGLT